jgi:hypothetical protein
MLIEKYGFYGAAYGQSIAFVLMIKVSDVFVVYKVSTQNRINEK